MTARCSSTVEMLKCENINISELTKYSEQATGHLVSDLGSEDLTILSKYYLVTFFLIIKKRKREDEL